MFNASLDNVITSRRETSNLFHAIQPGTLSGAQDAALHQDTRHLVEDDGRDVSLSFPDQLTAFCACLKSQKSKTINCEGSIPNAHRGAQVNLSASFIDVTVSHHTRDCSHCRGLFFKAEAQ